MPIPTPAKPRGGLLRPPPAQKGQDIVPIVGRDRAGELKLDLLGRKHTQTPGCAGIWGVLQEKRGKILLRHQTRLRHSRGFQHL